MLVLQLILAGDANFDTFPLWKWQEFWTAVRYRSIILPREEEAASHSEGEVAPPTVFPPFLGFMAL